MLMNREPYWDYMGRRLREERVAEGALAALTPNFEVRDAGFWRILVHISKHRDHSFQSIVIMT